tara:strand:+ start:203 stop:868 length:666 start_codon:yes stop_codon:yes gene_type:complete
MSEENMGKEIGTDTIASDQEKMFTQDDLDRIVADRIGREQRKFDKKISGIDLNEAKALKAEKEALNVERMKERGDFDSILKKTVETKDLEIQNYKSKLQETLVDGAIVGAAGSSNAVNPEQVALLLKRSARLSEDGAVEVLDANGLPRYNGKGDLLTVSEMVSEFLTVNPHFVRASGGGTGSMGNAGGINDGLVKTKTRAEFEQLNPAKRMQFVKSGGTIT